MVLAATLMLAAAVSSAQTAPKPAPEAIIKISGEVAHPLTLRMAELAATPHQNVSVADDQHRQAHYEGIPVADLLRRAGVPLGKELRGPKMKLYALVKARDGYAAVFALSEFDPGFTDRVILLVDQHDGHPLGNVEGPLRIIVPGEKRHARWVRQVVDIEIGTAR